jgi:hypothetical protein
VAGKFLENDWANVPLRVITRNSSVELLLVKTVICWIVAQLKKTRSEGDPQWTEQCVSSVPCGCGRNRQTSSPAAP